MSKRQVNRLSEIQRLFVQRKSSKAIPVMFLDAKSYEEVKEQLERDYDENGFLEIVFGDGEKSTVNEKTVIIVNDLEDD